MGTPVFGGIVQSFTEDRTQDVSQTLFPLGKEGPSRRRNSVCKAFRAEGLELECV